MLDRPEWTNENSYAFCAELDGAGWAWEFLRRNSQYAKDYHEALSRERHDQREFGKFKFSLTEEPQHTLYYYPPRQKGELVEQWSIRCRNSLVKPQVLTPLQNLCEKWFLVTAKDPYEANATNLDFNDPFYPELSRDFIDRYAIGVATTAGQDQHFLLAAFRLDLPLKEQCDRMLQLLRVAVAEETDTDNYRIPKPPLQPQHWLEYLRLLDAEGAGASSKEILKHVIPPFNEHAKEEDYPRKLVYQRLKAAKKMTEQYYYCLLIDPVQII